MLVSSNIDQQVQHHKKAPQTENSSQKQFNWQDYVYFDRYLTFQFGQPFTLLEIFVFRLQSNKFIGLAEGGSVEGACSVYLKVKPRHFVIFHRMSHFIIFRFNLSNWKEIKNELERYIICDSPTQYNFKCLPNHISSIKSLQLWTKT